MGLRAVIRNWQLCRCLVVYGYGPFLDFNKILQDGYFYSFIHMSSLVKMQTNLEAENAWMVNQKDNSTLCKSHGNFTEALQS